MVAAATPARGRSWSAEGFSWSAEGSAGALSGAAAGCAQRLGVAQRLDLAWFQKAPLAGVQIELQCAVADALDLLDVMADLLEHAAYLPVAAFGQDDPEALRTFGSDLAGPGFAAVQDQALAHLFKLA